MSCLVCGAISAGGVGSLCRKCAQAVAPCEGLIADHIRSNVTAVDADGWAVDGFGAAHALCDKTVIGRSQDNPLVVLATSVSRNHAELRRGDTGWTVRDLGSRNGTFVDGVRCQGHVTLPARAVVKVGDVALWFLAEVAEAPTAQPSLVTGGAAGGIVRFVIQHPGGELCAVGGSDPTTGGALLTRTDPSQLWGNERALPPLEFQLLRVLCGRAIEEAKSPAAVRGCAPTKQLAKDLPFQTRFANEENVRQVVKRLRGVLSEVGADGILAVMPGRGYYLACAVAAG